jgi:hypothetical protein
MRGFVNCPLHHMNEDGIGRSFCKHEEDKKAYCILVRNAEGKGPLGRPGLRWKNNNEVEFLVCRKGMSSV